MDHEPTPDNPSTAASSRSCDQYWKSASIDLAVCFVGIGAIALDDTSGLLLAVLLFYAYGFWVYHRSKVARTTHRMLKGEGLLGSIWMFIFFGVFAPFIHLFLTVPKLLPCVNLPDFGFLRRSGDGQAKPNPHWSRVRGPFANIWTWLFILILFSACLYLLQQFENVLLFLEDIVNGGPEMGQNIIGWFLHSILAIALYIVLLVLAIFEEYLWTPISIGLAAAFAGYMSWKKFLPAIGRDDWPKPTLLIGGSLATFVFSLGLYIFVVYPLLMVDIVSYGSLVDVLTSETISTISNG